MGQRTQHNCCISSSAIVIFLCFTALETLIQDGIKGVEAFGYDDYGGGGDPYGGDPGDGAYDPQDPHDPAAREEMMNDIQDQRSGYPNENNSKKKKFKLFEKRRLNHEKAKAFCNKREGQLAQAMNVDEMQRIQTLLMKGTTLSTSVWVGADKREWKKHSSKMMGLRPNLPPGAMMMGGGPTNMCPSMSMSTRSLAPVECYKEFAFICEFPPGKGKAPPKTGTKKPKKTTRKDEMRRKRRQIFSTTGHIQNDATNSSRYEYPSTENVPDEQLTLTQPSRENIVSSEESRQSASEEGSDSVNVQEAETRELNSSRSDIDKPISNYLDDSITETNGGGKVEVTETEVDPDEKLLNEFDEQWENMQSIVNAPTGSKRSGTFRPIVNSSTSSDPETLDTVTSSVVSKIEHTGTVTERSTSTQTEDEITANENWNTNKISYNETDEKELVTNQFASSTETSTAHGHDNGEPANFKFRGDSKTVLKKRTKRLRSSSAETNI